MRIFVAVLAVLGLAGAASAASITTGSTGIGSPTATLSFDDKGLGQGDPVDTQFAGDGVTFSPSVSYLAQYSPPASGRPGFEDGALFYFGTPAPLSIQFTGPVSAASLALTSNNRTTTFSALLNGTVLSSMSFVTDLDDPNFYLFTGMVFDEIRIQQGDAGIAFDTLSFTAVPLPAGFLLLLTGIGGLGVLGWRRGMMTPA